MIDKVFFRQSGVFEFSVVGILGYNELFQIAFEIANKNLVILGGKQPKYVVIVFLQMAKQMQKYRILRTTERTVVLPPHCRIKNVIEQLLAQFFKQKLLGFKMGIKGGSADIGSINDLLYRYLMVILF